MNVEGSPLPTDESNSTPPASIREPNAFPMYPLATAPEDLGGMRPSAPSMVNMRDGSYVNVTDEAGRGSVNIPLTSHQSSRSALVVNGMPAAPVEANNNNNRVSAMSAGGSSAGGAATVRGAAKIRKK